MKFYYKTLAFASLLALAACALRPAIPTLRARVLSTPTRTNLLIHRVLLIPM